MEAKWKAIGAELVATALILAGCNAILDNSEGELIPDGGSAGRPADANAGHAGNSGAPHGSGGNATSSNGGTNPTAGASNASAGTLGTMGGSSATSESTLGGAAVAGGHSGGVAGFVGQGGMATAGIGNTTRSTASSGNAGRANTGGGVSVGGTSATTGTPSPCTPEDGRCVNGQPQKCNATGQWINQPGCTQAAPTCSNGGCVCTTNTCNGACTDIKTDVMNCGGCGHPCSVSGATTARACTDGLCAPTCNPGYLNCNTPLSPGADDGCECAGTACCGSGCQTRHNSNGWEIYYSCSTGVDSSSAMDACKQYISHLTGTYACVAVTGGCVVPKSGSYCNSGNNNFAWCYLDSGVETSFKAGEVWITNSSCNPNTKFGSWN